MGRAVFVWSLLSLAVWTTGCASTSGVARPSPFPSPSRPAVPVPLPESVHSFSTSSFIAAAQQLQGIKYVLGGDSPATGFDCSGYTKYVYGLFRIPLPRTVGDQYRTGRPANRKELKAGDLLFFTTTGPGVTHVALAIGSDEFIHAPSENGVVRTEKLSSPYWRARFVGARRIL